MPARKKPGGGIYVAAGLGVVLAVAGGAGGHHHGHGILATLASIGSASPAGHHHHHGHGASVSGGNGGCGKLERLWEAAGGNPAQAQMAASIAMAESSGQQYSTDYNSNGTVDRGYWQINSIHGAQSTFNPMGNARAAVAISGNGSNWSPWVTYNTGAYSGRC